MPFLVGALVFVHLVVCADGAQHSCSPILLYNGGFICLCTISNPSCCVYSMAAVAGGIQAVPTGGFYVFVRFKN